MKFGEVGKNGKGKGKYGGKIYGYRSPGEVVLGITRPGELMAIIALGVRCAITTIMTEVMCAFSR